MTRPVNTYAPHYLHATPVDKLAHAKGLCLNGKFEEVQTMYPDRILFADDEHRLLITLNGKGQRFIPGLIVYSVNYCIQYEPSEQLFYTLKNRYRQPSDLCSLIKDLAGVELRPIHNNESVLEFICEEDKLIAKLKGFLCL